MTATEQLHDDLPLGDQTTTQEAEHVSESRTQPSNISALILANLALIVTVIFGAGITYARVGSIEVRVSALEVREAQLDALGAAQQQIQTLKEELQRVRDRMDGIRLK
jgi:uncharacterized protein HemX